MFHAFQCTPLLEAPRAPSHGHEGPFGHDAIRVEGRGDRGDRDGEYRRLVGLEFKAPAHRLREVVGEGQADARRAVPGDTFRKCRGLGTRRCRHPRRSLR